MKYPRIYRMVMETPWAILPTKLDAILAVLELRASGGQVSAEEIRAIVGAAERPQQRAAGSVAVLPIFGTISQRVSLMSEMSGGTSTEQFGKAFRSLMADASVGAIVLDVDSPGGGVFGVAELAESIFKARGQKPIVAVANSMAASAAYWLASAADELVVTPGGQVGSIGVFAAHDDISRANDAMGVTTTLISAGTYKTEGNPYEPLTDEARAAIQAQVDEYYGMFTAAVAKHRGASVKDVRGGFGEGRTVGAKEAVKLGMADRVATLDETIARLTGGRPARGAQRADDTDRRQRRLRMAAH